VPWGPVRSGRLSISATSERIRSERDRNQEYTFPFEFILSNIQNAFDLSSGRMVNGGDSDPALERRLLSLRKA
jgi:hypothetical protein